MGEKLRNRRQSLGLTLEDIEEETKIRKFYIIALEEDNYHLLPAMVYAFGFVRRYARMLGLDENEILQEFKRVSGKSEPRDDEETTAEVVHDRLNVPIKNILVGLIFLLVVIWMGTYLVDYLAHQDWGRNHTTPPPITNKGERPGEVPEKPEEPQVVEGVNLRITGIELCWIRATVDGELIPDTMLKAGEVKEIKAKESIKLHLGNAGGVRIEYNGEDMGVPGERGDTIRLEFPPPV
ncbi:MAG: helix-turn-helix domain-containing protein [Bacillota bacterium]